jgi:hypothetical protein
MGLYAIGQILEHRNSTMIEGYVTVVSHPDYEGLILIDRCDNPTKRMADMESWRPHGGFVLEHAVKVTGHTEWFQNAVCRICDERGHERTRPDGTWYRMSVEDAKDAISTVERTY